MKVGMRIERSSYAEDAVIFTHCFDTYDDYICFDFKLAFDLQELLDGDIIFIVLDASDSLYKLLYNVNISEALPMIEVMIQCKNLIIRALFDNFSDEEKAFYESVETFILSAYQLDNLISIRDKILKFINYSGVSNAVSD